MLTMLKVILKEFDDMAVKVHNNAYSVAITKPFDSGNCGVATLVPQLA